MPRTVAVRVYTIDELNSAAKERARAWYREGFNSTQWHDSVFENFDSICTVLGLTLQTRETKGPNNQVLGTKCIMFSGFGQHGDGASFEGSYDYTENSVDALHAYAPKDTTLHEIAQRLESVQQRNGCALQAHITQGGHYLHEHTMQIDVERTDDSKEEITNETEQNLTDAIRDLAKWLYQQLEFSFTSKTGDEAIDENLRTNEWEFTHTGEIFHSG